VRARMRLAIRRAARDPVDACEPLIARGLVATSTSPRRPRRASRVAFYAHVRAQLVREQPPRQRLPHRVLAARSGAMSLTASARVRQRCAAAPPRVSTAPRAAYIATLVSCVRLPAASDAAGGKRDGHPRLERERRQIAADLAACEQPHPAVEQRVSSLAMITVTC
jgi:hypothetical protein